MFDGLQPVSRDCSDLAASRVVSPHETFLIARGFGVNSKFHKSAIEFVVGHGFLKSSFFLDLHLRVVTFELEAVGRHSEESGVLVVVLALGRMALGVEPG